MKALTQAALIDMLNGIKGATFATIITETDPKLKKTGNTLGTVRKVSRVNVTLGFQYEKSVNRQRTREDAEADFQVKPRQWGKHVSPMLIEHKGRIYLETKVERVISTAYVDASGRTLDADIVRPFLPARRGKGRQEVQKEIIVRDYALNSIRSITVKGEEHVMIQEVTAPVQIAAPVPRQPTDAEMAAQWGEFGSTY